VDIAGAVYGRTRGRSVGEIYSGEDPIPVAVHSAGGERIAVADLEAVDIPTRDGRMIPLGQVAHIEPVMIRLGGCSATGAGCFFSGLIQVIIDISIGIALTLQC
jgi:hypothetical protein